MKERIDMKKEKEKREEKSGLEDGQIESCPMCGVELKGDQSCKYIICPCAPRITV